MSKRIDKNYKSLLNINNHSHIVSPIELEKKREFFLKHKKYKR